MKPFFLRQLRTRCWLPEVLAAFLLLAPPAHSQAPAAPSQAAPAPPSRSVRSLRITPLAGNKENNDLERGIMAPLVVQVLDQNARPVEGADVVFRFPTDGPGATFSNQQTFQTFRTNAQGQAAATGWVANRQVGTFQVRVSASRGNEVGETVISMTNVTRVVSEGKPRRKSWWSSKWAKVGIGVGVAGAVTAIILLTRDSDSAPAVITATPGPPTIGGPQ